jgi:hypothetical protein
LRVTAEKTRHLCRRLQIAFGIGLQFQTGFGDRNIQPDGGEHVLKRTALRYVIEGIIDRHQRHACRRRHARRLFQPEPVASCIGRRNGEPYGSSEAILHGFQEIQRLFRRSFKIRHDCKGQEIAPFEKIATIEN